MSEHIVVVGHGMVSHRFVSTLGTRHADADVDVTVIGDDGEVQQPHQQCRVRAGPHTQVPDSGALSSGFIS